MTELRDTQVSWFESVGQWGVTQQATRSRLNLTPRRSSSTSPRPITSGQSRPRRRLSMQAFAFLYVALSFADNGVRMLFRRTTFGLTGSVLVFGFHGFLSERKFSIHKVPLETYMSKLCVYFLTTPSAGFLIQLATMWKTHTPTVLVDAAIVLSKRALPDEYRQLSPSSRSHTYPFSPTISVASFSPH